MAAAERPPDSDRLDDAGTRTESARKRFWRSIAEAQAAVSPASAPPALQRMPTGRRDFMKIMGASLALAGTAGCSRPAEKIVPYRDGPPQRTYGKPIFYAS